MKDFLGRTIELGDIVVYSTTNADLYQAEVVGFGAKMVIISQEGKAYRTHNRFTAKVLVITYRKHNRYPAQLLVIKSKTKIINSEHFFA